MKERREPRDADDRLLEPVRRLPRDIEPPGDLWRDVAAALRPGAAPRSVPGPHRAWGLAPRFASWRIRPALAAALVVALGAALWLHVRSAPAWRVVFTAGRPTLAGGAITTDSASAARVAVGGGRLGAVDIAPRSHVRLLTAARLEQRLALDVGTIRARISAPPRLFVVETPSATAVDLGCAYTLAVDRHGASLIHVTLGWVELDRPGGTSVVPFNMSAYARPGFAPGTPFADHADAALKAALYRFDFEQGGDGALAIVLERANASDAVTLWHLLRRTSGAARALVYLRLAALAPPPPGVTQEAVLRLRARDLQTWWDALPGSPGALPWWQRIAVRISAWLGVL